MLVLLSGGDQKDPDLNSEKKSQLQEMGGSLKGKNLQDGGHIILNKYFLFQILIKSA